MSYDSDHWAELQTLFHLAEETPESERERVLGAACSEPDLLRRALEILTAAAPVKDPGPEPAAGNIGPYKLIRHLGTGGTGAVYLAERVVGSVIQKSAVKVLAPHAAGAGFIERFDREQRILASLEHPNIVRMQDAGITANGQPYLVMEYVDGVHLDEYCDREKLGIAARIRLFLAICDGVDYAHRNLVVHLDLKPSNLLVTTNGAVKLLDFGTSKLMQNDGRITATVMATPAYASPEQLRNEPVTTACDIYSLGVVLFELVTGKRPTSTLAIDETGRWREPEGPESVVTGPAAAADRGTTENRLRGQLAGDLSTVIRKCLRPSPEDRYLSIGALSGDLTRYLEGRPVLARPQTTLYQVSKFVRRNRGRVSLALVLGIALAGSLFYAWQGQRLALKEAQRAMQMQTFMYRLFQSANSNYTGKPAATVAEFLELGVKVLPEYIKNPGDLRQAQLSLGASMFQSRDFKAAEPVFEQIMASAKAAGDTASEVEADTYLCTIRSQQGHPDTGLPLCERAIAHSGTAGVPAHTRALAAMQYASNREDAGIRDDENVRQAVQAVQISREHQLPPHETALALTVLASLYQQRGAMEKAEPLFQEALGLYRQDPLALCEQGDIFYGLAGIRQKTNRQEEAPPLFQKAYDTYKTCSGAEDRETLRMGAYYAGALIDAGRAREAVPMLESALPIWEKANAGNAFGLREILHFLDLSYLETGRFADAEKIAARELAMHSEAKIPRTERMVGFAEFLMARALAGQGKYREALPHAEFAAGNLAVGAVSPGAKRLLEDARTLVKKIYSKLDG